MTAQTRESRYDAFCKDLTELCRRHGVQLATSHNEDSIQVWDACDDGSPIWQHDRIDMCLEETPPQAAIEWMERQRLADAK